MYNYFYKISNLLLDKINLNYYIIDVNLKKLKIQNRIDYLQKDFKNPVIL